MKSFLPRGRLSTLFRRQQRAFRRIAAQSAPGALRSTTTKGVLVRPTPQRARGAGSSAYYA